MRVLLILCALFALCTCSLHVPREEANGHEPFARDETRHSRRDSVSVLNAIEITEGINGTLSGNDTFTYSVSLDAHEVLDFYIQYSYYGIVTIYLQGSTNSWDVYGDSTNNISLPHTLAYHCPEYAAKYYFNFNSYNGEQSNFTLYISKRDILPLESTKYSASVNFYTRGYIALPIATQCSQLLVDVFLSQNIRPRDVTLKYMCRVYNSDCESAQVPQQFIYQTSNTSASRAYYHQFYVNCTAPGVYYLSLPSGQVIDYTINTYSSYPCPLNCWEGGICDFSNATCICKSGYIGESCTPGGPVSKRDVGEVVLKPDGSTYNYTKLEQVQKLWFKIDFTPTNASQAIRLRFSSSATQASANFYAYFNPGSYGAATNYTSYTRLTGVGLSKVVYLCAMESTYPWYIHIVLYSTAVDLLLTVDTVAIPEIQDTFDGYAPSSNSLTVQPFVYKFTPTGRRLIIQANETAPGLSGLYLYSICGVFQDMRDGWSSGVSSDSGFGYGRYQIYTTSARVTQSYYVVVGAVSGSNFTGTITTNVTNAGSCSSCSGSSQGFCTQGDYCICRKGYKTSNCSVVDFPADAIQLRADTPNIVTLPSGRPFYDSIVYAIAPIAPVGYSIYVEGSNLAVNFFVTEKFPIASPTGSATFYTQSTGSVGYGFSQCVVRQPQQYYFALTPRTSIGGDVNITFTIKNASIPNDGSKVPINLNTGYTPFISYLPKSCASAYHITVEGSQVYSLVAGEGSYTCYSESTFYGDYTNNGYSVILPIKNCTSAIDLQVGSSKAGQVNITISPTIPCPGNCNDRGQCRIGGICECEYPYVGLDCGAYDAVCMVLPDEGICKSDFPSSYREEFSSDEDYCSLQYESYNAEKVLIELAEQLDADDVSISVACQNELEQILCDSFKYRCQNQNGGGVKLMLPCNSLTWQKRCLPSHDIYISFLENIMYDVQRNLESNLLFVCNNHSPSTSTSSSTSSSSNSSSTRSATTGPRPTSSSSSSSLSSSTTTTTDIVSDAGRLIVCKFVIAVILIALLVL